MDISSEKTSVIEWKLSFNKITESNGVPTHDALKNRWPLLSIKQSHIAALDTQGSNGWTGKCTSTLKKDNINEFKPFVPFEIRWILLVPSVLKYRGATFEMGECTGYLLVGFVKTSKSYGCTSI